jgi:hypothetical protein
MLWNYLVVHSITHCSSPHTAPIFSSTLSPNNPTMAVFKAVAPLLIPLILSFPAVGTAAPCPNTTSASRILHIAHQTKGVLTVSFDPAETDSQKSIQILSSAQAGYQPGWLCSHGDGFIYSVSRTQYPYNSSDSGGAFTFQTTRDGLELIGDTSTDGKGSVFCDINKAGTVFSAANMCVFSPNLYLPFSFRNVLPS